MGIADDFKSMPTIGDSMSTPNNGDHPVTPGFAPIPSAPAPQEAPTKATKAIWGTVIVAISMGLAGAATVLPSPWDGYAQAAVSVIGIVAAFFGIYIPANKPK